ncbi:MAG: response regulator transcription factor [Pseudomonadota bacterium]|nr:response regulator transcription factor [Pseudomonadota bacterium]|tara:strand:- start:155 stop:847 length:693 start_codon:yes stop_codon:yes gene_type:complete
MSKHILIVEDEKDLSDTLEYNFKNAGYKVSMSLEGNKAISLATGKNNPDLVILDLMLPDISGLDVCKEIRSNPVSKNTPILMLTAKGEEVDRILGFELGADDYLVKPFSLRELTLRVAALLKRNVPVESDENIILGDLNIDLAAHRVFLETNEVTLTAKEFDLLVHLARHNGRVQTRDYLLEQIWGYSSDVTTRTVDTHIKRLRSKIGSFGNLIETVRSIGYRLNYNSDT